MAKANLADYGDRIMDETPVEPTKAEIRKATPQPLTPDGYTAEFNVEDLISSDGVSFDHIRALAPFLAIAERITDASTAGMAPKIIGQLSQGFRKAGEYLAIAKYQYAQARNDRKREEAVAFIDEFPKYIQTQHALGIEVKGTDTLRTHFVARYPAVLKAKEREAFYEAVQEQLITMKTELFMAISSAKSIAYGFKDQNMLSSAATTPLEDREKDS